MGNLRSAGLACFLLAGTVMACQAQGGAYPHAGEPIGTVRQMYSGELTPDLSVNTFRNIDRLFTTRTVARGSYVYPLPRAAKQLTQVGFMSRGQHWDLTDYLAVNRVAGLLVLKNGRIALELYQYGNTPATRWMAMSITKSITSTLIAAALKQGYIASLDDPVTKYVPKLIGTAYDGVSIREVLTMSSGVKWNETYTDPKSDRRHFLEAQINQQPGGVLGVMAKLPRAARPGYAFNYSTGEVQIAGEVLRGAVKRPLSQYLSERIWSRFGMEADAKWWLDSPDGTEIAGTGLSATMRDLGRFGLFFLNGGVAGGQQILPPGWTREAGRPQTLRNGKKIDYGYLWWPAWPTAANPHPRDAFSGVGIFGQYLYIDPQTNVVIVVQSARSKPTGRDVIDDMDFFTAVVAALH